jgi:rhodanese-related sulfurtransferase
VKPRRTHESNAVFELAGGNEDNALWLRRAVTEDNEAVLVSVWEPDETERARIAAGENIELIVWGTGTPPCTVGITDVPLGKAPETDADAQSG